MLKLVLKPGDGLERSLSAGARQLERLIEDGIREGYVRLRVYPRADLLIASAAFLSLLYSFNIRPLFKVSVKPPSAIDVPTMILGYNNPSYKTGDVSSTLVSISLQADNPPPPSATYISGEGSVPAMLGLLLARAGASYARTEWLLLLLSAAYWGEYIEKSGKMHGLDALLYSELSRMNTGLEIVNTLKVYKPTSTPLCQAVARTIDPYYPGLTGDPDACTELLQGSGVGELAGRIAARLSPEELEKTALVILSHLKDEVGQSIDVSEYVAGLVVSRTLGFDPRLRANSILYAADSIGDPSLAVSIASQQDTVAEKLEEHHMDSAQAFAAIVGEARLVKTKVQPWIRGYKVMDEVRVSPLFLWRALKLSGRINDSHLLFDYEGKLCASSLQVEEALGYGEARKLVEVKAAVEEGLRLCVRENASRG